MNLRQLRLILVVSVVVLLTTAGGVYAGMKWQEHRLISDGNVVDDQTNLAKDFKEIGHVKNIIQNHYIEEIDDATLLEGAVKGMLETLDDPYSTYMDEEMAKQFEEQIESSFEGIGAEVGMENGQVTIIAPIQDSPAEKVGLRSKDKIIKIDGDSIKGLDLMEAVDKIRGEKGSTVTLEIERAGVKEPFDVEVVREEIPIETVYSEVKEQDGKKTGILKLTNFSDNTAADFKKELEALENDDMDGLIIDVRGNPGGLLEAVEEILVEFVPKDLPYVQIEDRDGNKDAHYSELEEKKDYPIVVLTDEGSASASEILAVALKEVGYDVVGTTSYGKGTVQQALSIDQNIMVKLTSFKWLSPEGNWIHEKGVKPTIEVKQPEYYYSNPVNVEKKYKHDDSDADIGNIQVMLKGLGYDVDREDGYFSKQTDEAVKGFQKDNDLKATGVVDEDTAQMLEAKILEKIREKDDDLQLQKAEEVIYK